MSKSTSTELVNSTNLETVYFKRDEIPVVMLDGVPYVVLKPLVENLGLTWHGQFERLKRDPVLSSVVRMTRITAADGKSYMSHVLPLEFVPGFLFTIDANRVNEAARPIVIDYQRYCYGVLAAHFGLLRQGTITHLEDKLAEAQHRLDKAARDCFQRRPHWRTIHDLYLRSYRFTEIARRVRRSASACRHAVKRMVAMGIMPSMQVSMHKVLSRG